MKIPIINAVLLLLLPAAITATSTTTTKSNLPPDFDWENKFDTLPGSQSIYAGMNGANKPFNEFPPAVDVSLLCHCLDIPPTLPVDFIMKKVMLRFDSIEPGYKEFASGAEMPYIRSPDSLLGLTGDFAADVGVAAKTTTTTGGGVRNLRRGGGGSRHNSRGLLFDLTTNKEEVDQGHRNLLNVCPKCAHKKKWKKCVANKCKGSSRRRSLLTQDEAVPQQANIQRRRLGDDEPEDIAKDAMKKAKEAMKDAQKAAEDAAKDADDAKEKKEKGEMDKVEEYVNSARNEANIAANAATEAAIQYQKAAEQGSKDDDAEEYAGEAAKYANDAAKYAEDAKEAAGTAATLLPSKNNEPDPPKAAETTQTKETTETAKTAETTETTTTEKTTETAETTETKAAAVEGDSSSSGTSSTSSIWSWWSNRNYDWKSMKERFKARYEAARQVSTKSKVASTNLHDTAGAAKTLAKKYKETGKTDYAALLIDKAEVMEEAATLYEEKAVHVVTIADLGVQNVVLEEQVQLYEVEWKTAISKLDVSLDEIKSLARMEDALNKVVGWFSEEFGCELGIAVDAVGYVVP